MKKISSSVISFFDKWLITPITKFFLLIASLLKNNGRELEKLVNKKQTIIVLSLVCALGVFFIVDKRTDNIVNKKAEVLYDQPVKAEYNKEAYVIEGLPESVDVTLIGRTADLYLAKQYASNLSISVDLRDLTPGSHKVKLNYNQSQALKTIDYKLDPSTANVVVYEKVSETRELDYDIIHKEDLSKTFVIKSVKLSRNDVIVKGPSYKLKSVANVKALVDMDKISNPKVGNYNLTDISLVAYDATGDKVDVEIVPETVEAQLEITSPSKEVPIQIIPDGNVAFGKAIKQLSSEITKVTIYGSDEALNNVTSIPVHIDVTDLAEDKTFNINITKPSGIRDISEKAISIKVSLVDEITKEFDNVRVSYINLNSKYKAQALSQKDATITVIVKGSGDLINNLDVNTIKATVDLKDYTEGEYEVDVKVSGDDLKLNYDTKTKKINVRIDKN